MNNATLSTHYKTITGKSLNQKVDIDLYLIDSNTEVPIEPTLDTLMYKTTEYDEANEWADFLEDRRIPYSMFLGENKVLNKNKKSTQWYITSNQPCFRAG